jgi:nitrite reductase/ring-hydroxylating ferredoxin subunit
MLRGTEELRSMSISAVSLWSWYPIVASKDLQAGAVMPAMLHGERLVVWRSREGRLGIWNDRCPHRSMSLSLGSTIGEILVCPYHGWEFGPDGNCRRIPAHPATAPSRAARARVYPTVEVSGYVWACLGEPASAQPECGLLASAVPSPIRSMHVGVDAETVALILLSHPLTTRAEQTPAAPACQLDGDTLTVTHARESGSATCRVQLGLPSIVVCKLDIAGEPLSYAGLVQPTGENTACVHLALLGERTQAARLALNGALSRLRDRMSVLAQSGPLLELRDVLADSGQPAAMSVTSKGIDHGKNNRPSRAQ